MQVLESIRIRGEKRVDLCQGDLTELARNEWFDALVVSAFNADYTPTPTSVIGALHAKDVSVADLALAKETDYTRDYGTWLSGPLRATDPGIGYERILCFEPHQVGRPPEVVGHFFRALVPIVAERTDIRTLAMPVLSSGDAGYSIDEMLPPLVDAAVNTLGRGLPLDRIAIVVRDPEQAKLAHGIFRAANKAKGEYDVFVSYSQRDRGARESLVSALETRRPGTRVFVDQNEIDHGAAWQSKIFDSLDRCRRIVCLLTPNYLESPICLEEFNIAWMRTRESNRRSCARCSSRTRPCQRGFA